MKNIVFAGLAIAAVAATPVFAADMPVKAPPRPVVAAYSWTGCYVGSTVGGKFGESKHIAEERTQFVSTGSDITGKPIHIVGYLSGGEVGCQYQAGNFVFGVEADGAWSRVKGDAVELNNGITGNIFAKTEEKWIATARARAGVTFSENKGLLCVTGGGAWAGAKVSEFNANVGLPAIVYGTESRTLSGWTAGAGLEWVLLGPLTAKVEYLYMQLNKKRFFEDCGCLASERDVDARQHIIRLGLNYRFTP